jgi:hypothetical protein
MNIKYAMVRFPLYQSTAPQRDMEVQVLHIYKFDTVYERCPKFLYIGAHLTDGCGGAGGKWRLQY